MPSTEFKLRRKVKTGEWIRRRYPNPNISALHIHWGIRVVCSPCARAIDREAARREWRQKLELVVAIGLLLVVILLRLLGNT
jgi:hypothetical protein